MSVIRSLITTRGIATTNRCSCCSNDCCYHRTPCIYSITVILRHVTYIPTRAHNNLYQPERICVYIRRVIHTSIHAIRPARHHIVITQIQRGDANRWHHHRGKYISSRTDETVYRQGSGTYTWTECTRKKTGAFVISSYLYRYCDNIALILYDVIITDGLAWTWASTMTPSSSEWRQRLRAKVSTNGGQWTLWTVAMKREYWTFSAAKNGFYCNGNRCSHKNKVIFDGAPSIVMPPPMNVSVTFTFKPSPCKPVQFVSTL